MTRVVVCYLSAFLGISLVGLRPTFAQRDTALAHPFLVSEFPCPDPHVMTDGSDWYIFGTGAKPFFLQGKQLGEGHMKRVFLDIDYARCPWKVAEIWGFIVHRHTDGTYHGYGTLHLGNFHTVIANFEPRDSEKWEPGNPITKWRFTRIVVGDPSRQDWNYYESKILHDKTHFYLMYTARVGRDNFIIARKLKSWSQVDASVPPRVILKPDGFRSEDRNGPGSMQLVEGAAITKWKGKYILLYSVGDFLRDNYKLGMAFSNSLIPASDQTYHKVTLPDPKSVWGDKRQRHEIGYLLQSEKPQWPNYCGHLAVGPGLGSLVPIDDKLWLFFHGYKPEDKARRPQDRFVFRVPVTLAFDGRSPTLTWLHADLPDERALADQRHEEHARRARAFGELVTPGAVWQGVSNWGQNRTTKSELRCVKSTGDKSEWDFVFLEASIFKTPVPFVERWSGELIIDDKQGVLLRLTRHDGKAVHEYRVSGSGEMRGNDVNGSFTYSFAPKK
jgi:hypothetical protein